MSSPAPTKRQKPPGGPEASNETAPAGSAASPSGGNDAPAALENWSLTVLGLTPELAEAYDLLPGTFGNPGAFGHVRLAKHRASGETRAVKVVAKRWLLPDPACSPVGDGSRKRRLAEDAIGLLRTEIQSLRRLNHPGVIRFHDCFESPTEVHIVTELCEGGELFEGIQSRQRYGEPEARGIARQIFEAVRYLHSQGIAHGDLKPENVLFLDKAQTRVKLIDFGMAKLIRMRAEGRYFRSMCGTLYYTAPEVFHGRYDEACDLWSLGTMLFVMLIGCPVFFANSDEEVRRLIVNGFYPEVRPGYGPWFPSAIPISDQARSLIAALLRKDFAARLSAAEALEHSWFSAEDHELPGLPAQVLRVLREFGNACAFKSRVLGKLADQLPAHDLAEVRQAFEAMDTNKDGQLSLEEFREGLRRLMEGSGALRMEESEAARLFALVDANCDGGISYPELLAAVVQRKLLAKEERLYRAFSLMDLDGNGVLTAEEIRRSLDLDDLGAARELLQQVDKDGDGKVSYDEFLHRFLELQGQTMEDQLEGVRIQGALGGGDPADLVAALAQGEEHKDPAADPQGSSASSVGSVTDPLLQVQIYALMHERIARSDGRPQQRQQQAAPADGRSSDDELDSDLEQPRSLLERAGDHGDDVEDDSDDLLGPTVAHRRDR